MACVLVILGGLVRPTASVSCTARSQSRSIFWPNWGRVHAAARAWQGQRCAQTHAAMRAMRWAGQRALLPHRPAPHVAPKIVAVPPWVCASCLHRSSSSRLPPLRWRCSRWRTSAAVACAHKQGNNECFGASHRSSGSCLTPEMCACLLASFLKQHTTSHYHVMQARAQAALPRTNQVTLQGVT